MRTDYGCPGYRQMPPECKNNKIKKKHTGSNSDASMPVRIPYRHDFVAQSYIASCGGGIS